VANKTYIQFPGIIGDSKDRVHLGWFNVLSWTFGTPQATFGEGGGKIKDMLFEVELYGKGIPDLEAAIKIGTQFAKVTLDDVRENGSLHYRIEFNDAMLSGMTSRYHFANFWLQFKSMTTTHYDAT
jgi:hypothetical protein